MRSLAPAYGETQHSGYVRHLENAITDPKNRNIALTGRYGAGKSSVLDKFESDHLDKTLRISINTLGPDEDQEDLTNRIQKELVKQLVYRAKPGKLRRSRFARTAPLTRSLAFLQALCLTTIVLALLWLIGFRPGDSWFGGTTDPSVKMALGALFFALVVVVVWVARWIIGDRIVSQVTTAGTTITLGEKPSTYFDGFLDEIVAFFDAVEPEYVIFEDLDRFDDPQIFDSLRELNTLINSSAHWKSRSQPLRFIYAIKDSLFEQLGTDPEIREKKAETSASGNVGPAEAAVASVDLAVAAVERANRTKFFEIVIPMVPFISHRNARDHLVDSFRSLGLAEDLVKRPLLDLVARHTTDMRLLINICNEFVVFAEHLLWVENCAPGMTADDLFALVVYKNFHLADFEAISQRASSLDTLEQHHRELVRASIELLQKQRRDVMHTEGLRRTQEQTAQLLGSRLCAIKDTLPNNTGYPYNTFTVGETSYSSDDLRSVPFWKQVAYTGSISIASPQRSGYGPPPVHLNNELLSPLFPEAIGPARWRDPNPSELAKQVERCDRDIAFLRGAGFSDLVNYEPIPKGATTFNEQVAKGLKSELARDLVRRGFINRNYAEYSATFYGSFIGVDVAFFYNHSVQPNQMYLDFEFTTANAISNLLEQVPSDFTSSVSALNIQVVSYLLSKNSNEARKVVAFIVADHSRDVQTFLDAFFNAVDEPREQLVALLAAHPWPGLIEYIASDSGIPDDKTRMSLLDAALLNGLEAEAYNLGEASVTLLTAAQPHLTAFNETQSPERTELVLSFAKSAEVLVADLNDLAEPLRERIVAEQMYELTTSNLRLALGIQSAPTLDEVRKKDNVWQYCRKNVDEYLAAARSDDPVEYVVRTEAALRDIVTEQHEDWTEEQLGKVIAGSSPAVALKEITAVPSETWPAVIEGARVVPTVENIWAYVQANQVDQHLARFLAPDGKTPIELHGVDETEADTRTSLAIQILNAIAQLQAATRVRLAVGLNLPSALEATALEPAGDDLLALALEAGLVPDAADTFAHFAQAGWKSVSEAFAVSKNMDTILTPGLVSGFVADLLASRQVPHGVRDKVVNDLALYVVDDNVEALRAAGAYAREMKIWLPLVEVQRIARVTQDPDLVLSQLVRARDLSPEALMEMLALLGSPYSTLTGGLGAEFTLPPGSSNNTLFERLATAGKVEIVKDGWGSGKKVRNLV
ncbi:hypothetical protein NicSoilB8_17320 [Arthrobacter sp. NicSoilB8]|nr:hypothetical protein NicSoilB8_17320 [Arthrobacter sp. NicSoilB8]